MPLQQINLKVPEQVAAHWRAQAAAAGVSVRDWLVSITAPTATAPAAPAAGADGPELAERVALLEAATAELRDALALLQAGPPRPPRSPRPAPAAPRAAAPPPADLPADGIETSALADLLGLKRGTFNARVLRAGGPHAGLVLDGWRCLGLQPADRGGPPRARWLPAGSD